MLDMDGTLMHEGDWFPGSLDLLAALDRAGIAVALCSGRAIHSLRASAAGRPEVSLLAGAGGAVVQGRDGDGWRTVGIRHLPAALVAGVEDRTRELGMELWAYTPEEWLIRERSPRVEFDESFTHTTSRVAPFTGRDDVVKLLTFGEDDAQQAYLAELAAVPGIGVASSFPGYWDVIPADALATKGGDLLVDVVGCSWREVLAVGDGGNDLGMLSKAGTAYALAPRTLDELDPAEDWQWRRAGGRIIDVLADLRERGIVE